MRLVDFLNDDDTKKLCDRISRGEIFTGIDRQEDLVACYGEAAEDVRRRIFVEFARRYLAGNYSPEDFADERGFVGAWAFLKATFYASPEFLGEWDKAQQNGGNGWFAVISPLHDRLVAEYEAERRGGPK
jgi:hypothetical protein